MTCINCSAEVSSNYCSNCGQRQTVKRLSVKEGWNDFWARIYGFDGMFPRTLRDITMRPGEVSRKYIEGNRVAYYGPVGYFFLMITLMYLVASLFNIDVMEFMKSGRDFGIAPQAKVGSGQEHFSQSMLKLMSDNLKLFSFMMIPIFAFCSRFLFFRKQGLNYVEHMVLPFFVQGHVYWISIFSLILYAVSGHFLLTWIQLLITIIFTSYAYANLFAEQGKIKSFLKGFGVYVVTYMIVAFLAMGFLVILIAFNPDIFEMLKPSNNR